MLLYLYFHYFKRKFTCPNICIIHLFLSILFLKINFNFIINNFAKGTI